MVLGRRAAVGSKDDFDAREKWPVPYCTVGGADVAADDDAEAVTVGFVAVGGCLLFRPVHLLIGCCYHCGVEGAAQAWLGAECSGESSDVRGEVCDAAENVMSVMNVSHYRS